jgi:hypothetical protein
MFMAALLGSTMYLLNGCGWGVNGQMRTILAILQEDIFG